MEEICLPAMPENVFPAHGLSRVHSSAQQNHLAFNFPKAKENTKACLTYGHFHITFPGKHMFPILRSPWHTPCWRASGLSLLPGNCAANWLWALPKAEKWSIKCQQSGYHKVLISLSPTGIKANIKLSTPNVTSDNSWGRKSLKHWWEHVKLRKYFVL